MQNSRPETKSTIMNLLLRKAWEKEVIAICNEMHEKRLMGVYKTLDFPQCIAGLIGFTSTSRSMENLAKRREEIHPYYEQYLQFKEEVEPVKLLLMNYFRQCRTDNDVLLIVPESVQKFDINYHYVTLTPDTIEAYKASPVYQDLLSQIVLSKVT